MHSANEPLLIAGVGTMADEIFDREPAPDVVIVPIGLGSGICGTAIVAAKAQPRHTGDRGFKPRARPR